MVYKAKHNNLYPPYMNPPLQYKCNGGYNFKKDQFKSNFFFNYTKLCFNFNIEIYLNTRTCIKDVFTTKFKPK